MISVNITHMDWWIKCTDPCLREVKDFFAMHGVVFSDLRITKLDGWHLQIEDPELAMLFKLTFQ